MSKSTKKKPARPPVPQDAIKVMSGVSAALQSANTRPTDAGKASAKTGGKSESNNKGR